MEEIPPKKTIWNTLKIISPATYFGLVLVVLFLIFCKIDDYAVRWQIMLPLAAVAGGLLYWRRKYAPILESRICTVGLCILVALFLLRDIGMSNKLAELLDKVNQCTTEVNQFSTELNRFIVGGR